MTSQRTQDPEVEPVSVEELKGHIYIESSFDDLKLARIIAASRQYTEEYTDRSLITQQWVIRLDKWPCKKYISLPKGLIQSIDSFTYLDEDEEEQTLEEDTDYVLENMGDSAFLSPVECWPSVFANRKGVISVTYKTGYGDAAENVPAWAKEAILAMCASTYDNGATDTSRIFKMFSDSHRLHFNYHAND